MEPQDARKLLDAYRDHAKFCARCLRVEDKKGNVVPLNLWPSQIKLSQAIAKQQAARRPVRIIGLKARRVGWSLNAAAEIFRRIAFLPGQHAAVVAHDYPATVNLFRYYQQFMRYYTPLSVEGVPGSLGLPDSRPVKETIEWEHGSWVRCITAGSPEAARSYSLRFLQLDEFAFWPDANRALTALMQCVPDDPDTMVLILSTANGVGGAYYDLWQRAVDPSADSEWIAVFLGCHDHPEYVRPLDVAPDRFQASMTDEEHELQQRFGVSLEFLNWRRWCIENNCAGNIDSFHQEYPMTPEEAFIASGRPRFDMRALSRMPILRDPIVGGLEEHVVGPRRQVVFEAREKGELLIYRKPTQGEQYVIGADAAEGIDTGSELGSGSDPDYASAQVLNLATGEQVAKLRARLQPSIFAEYLYFLGKYYNWAYLVPEANNMGIAVIEHLLRLQYPMQYLHERRRDPDDRSSSQLHRLGFKTTTVTRPQLISDLDLAIREQSVIIRDANTLQECRTFVIGSNGKAAAQQGCHDDDVMALALAVHGLKWAPRETRNSILRTDVRSASSATGLIRPQRYGYKKHELEDRL
jgi:hypothetical protein